MPKPTDAMPSVIMNGETLNTATPMPLTTPTKVPAPMPARMPKVSVISGRVGVGGVERRHGQRGDHRGDGDDRADREIEAAGEQRQHLPQATMIR